MNDYLIIGAGFLGRELISWLQNHKIITVNKTRNSAKELVLRFPKITAIATNILNKEHHLESRMIVSNFKGTVFCLLPPSSFGQKAIDSSISNLLTFFEVSSVRRAILVSSTSVYSESSGGKVICDSDTFPYNFRSTRLLQIEERWKKMQWDSVIVRFAGIYGKERIVGRSSLRNKTALDGSGKEWLNLIHVVDAARALARIANASRPQSTYLLTDGHPLVRKDYYEVLANKYGFDAPRFKNHKSDSSSKLCDSSADWNNLGITPYFANAIALLSTK